MSFNFWVWLFVMAITLHNLEEAIWLPPWSGTGGKWRSPVGDFEFRFAVVILTLIAVASAMASTVGGKESWGTYAVTGYAFAMLLNVFSPHVLVTIVTRRYMPGLATAVLAVLPAAGYLVSIALARDYVRTPQFFGWAALMTVGLLASIRPLFALGSRLARPSAVMPPPLAHDPGAKPWMVGGLNSFGAQLDLSPRAWTPRRAGRNTLSARSEDRVLIATYRGGATASRTP